MKTDKDHVILFYAIFCGYTYNFSAMFFHPFYALCWTRWMIWKSMLPHLWIKKHKNPLWHTCVGVVSVHCSSILLVNKEFNLWGDTSREFFKDVCIYEYVGNEKLETTLIRCSDSIYNTSSKLFKYHADYQQLAGSIFEKRSQCCNLVHSEDTDTYLGWLVTPKNTIGISGVTDDYGSMDVGK